MQRKKTLIFLFLGALMLFVGTALWLLQPQPAKAQCGSQASSCKTCHEVQSQKPVNSDGTGWHQSHAFGDFCVFCHAGNEQATDKVAAHTGMVPPLSDVKSACQSAIRRILTPCPGLCRSSKCRWEAVTSKSRCSGSASTEQAATPAAAQPVVQLTIQPTGQTVQPTAQSAAVSAVSAGRCNDGRK